MSRKDHIKARLHGYISPPRTMQAGFDTRPDNVCSRDRPIPGAPVLLRHLIKRTKGD